MTELHTVGFRGRSPLLFVLLEHQEEGGLRHGPILQAVECA